MFVLTLTYTAPLEEVDALLPAHRDWLEEHYAAGELLTWGRRVPRVGGVIIAAGSLDRARVDEIVAGDPFTVHGVATYEVVEFTPVKAAPGLEGLLEA